MHPLLDRDLDRFDAVLATASDIASGYLGRLAEAPVVPSVSVPAAEPLPARGAGAEAALAAFERDWLPTIAASAGPRFQGFVTGGSTPAAVAGDWLASALDQNLAVAVGGADALERQAIRWVAELLGLGAHEGTFVTGATGANLVALAAAREWAGRRGGVRVNAEGWRPGLAVVLAGAAHSSVGKALSILGMGRDALVGLPLLPGREALDPDAAAAACAAAQAPVIVVASAGTVNSGDFDDLDALLALRERFGFWLHVDGAFGAFAALDDRVRHLVERMGEADSVTVDLHKWLNVPYDSGLVFTRHRDAQVDVFHNASAYLPAPGDDPDFMHLAPENSRRFRGLPAWLALRAYGREGVAEIVSRQLDHAALLASLIEALPGGRVLAAPRLNVVVFALGRPTADVLDALSRSGEAYLTPTRFAGEHAIRSAFSNWRTTEADVRRLAAALAAASLDPTERKATP